MAERGASSSAFPWPALLVASGVGAVMAAGLAGLLPAWGQRLALQRPAASLALAALGLAPLGFYALALERGKPAPALRHAFAPWVLFALLHLSVQLGGGPLSPLLAAYPLLMLFLGRHAAWGHCVAILLLLSAQMGLPLEQAAREGAPYWPAALGLGLPWVGLGLGWLSRDAAAAAPKRKPAPTPAETAPATLPLPERDGLDAARLLQDQLRGSLEVLHATFPGLGGLTLWWGDGEGMRLWMGVTRAGTLRQEAEIKPGESLLGLALRERRLLTVEPLAEAAAAELPYYEAPAAARCLRVQPLRDEDKVVGLLACDKPSEESFSPAEAAALEALGRQLVRHAQQAAYLSRLQAQGGRTQRLYDAAQALTRDLDRPALLQRFGELLGTLVPCDSWLLAMREEDEQPMRRLEAHGYLSQAPETLAVERSSALAAALEGSEGALLFNRVEGAQVPAALAEGLLGEAQHFLLAPLRLGGRLAGVLKLDRRSQPFSEEERDIAFIFASQAAVTLENARLYTLHHRQATTDGLTGLYNHRYFQERLALEIDKAARSERPLSLALTDIDFFKKFNDTFGHQEGDVVLKRVAQTLKERVRPDKDIVCRYGGEEFVVILPDCDVVEARQVMDALRAHCAAELIGGSGPEARAITLSIGLCTYPQGATEQKELIHLADEALYKAKHAGRNQVCSYRDL